MGSVGLLYVGAVLFVNGLMLLGTVPVRSASVLNLFVGALQCVVPTVMLIQAQGDSSAVLAASGLYLFGFTYLYVGISNLAGFEPEGIGWFSLFVACAALVYSFLSFTVSNDPVFGVIWLAWAALWTLFFLVLGLGRENLSRFTGWAAVLLSQPSPPAGPEHFWFSWGLPRSLPHPKLQYPNPVQSSTDPHNQGVKDNATR